MHPQKKDLLTLLDYSAEEIESILARAKELKRTRLTADPKVFASKTGVLIFEKPSLRTRITFETSINELGGHTINLAADMVGMGRRETVEDVGRNLERWVHLIVARTYRQETLERLASACRVPVINALSDSFHPCQALAFGLTLLEHRGASKKQKVVFIGDGNNVCCSLMALCAKLGFDFTVSSPAGYAPKRQIVDRCLAVARSTGSTIELCPDAGEAVRNAAAVYTDVWTSMGQEKEAEKRSRDFAGYQVNDALLAKAPPDVVVSHCLPAHREEEITSAVLDSDKSIAFDEAENRLHVQKAVIVHLFS